MSSIQTNAMCSLKKIAPSAAELTNTLLRLLTQNENSRAICAVIVDANFNANAVIDMPVFVVDEHCAFAVFERCDASKPDLDTVSLHTTVAENSGTFGNAALAASQDIDHALNVLDMADSILNYTEKCLSIALDPKFIAARSQSVFADEDAVILVLKSGALSVQLALNANTEQRAKWTGATANIHPGGRGIPCSIIIECEAARLPVNEAAQMEAGDMLLLPSQAQAAWYLQTDNIAKTHRNGILHITNAALRITNQIYHCEENGMSDGTDTQNVLEPDDVLSDNAPSENPSRGNRPNAQNGTHAFTVPVSLRLPALYYDAETLGALREGSSLPIVPLTQGLHVELLVGGRTFAHGEIVEIGDNFGVLITKKIRTAPDYPKKDATDMHDSVEVNIVEVNAQSEGGT